MPDDSALDFVTNALRDLVAPLLEATASEAAFRQFLADMGWMLRDGGVNPADAAADLLARVDDITDNPSAATLQDLVETLIELDQFRTALTGFATAIGAAAGAGDQNLTAELATDVIQHLTVTWLKRTWPTAYTVLDLLGIVVLKAAGPVGSGGDPPSLARIPLARPVLNLGAVADLVRDPIGHLKNRLGVVDMVDTEAAARMLRELFMPLARVIVSRGGTAYLSTPRPPGAPAEASDLGATLVIPLGTSEDDPGVSAYFALTATLVPAGRQSPDSDAGPGIHLVPEGRVELTVDRGGSAVTFALTGGGTFYFPQGAPPVMHGSAASGVRLQVTYASGPDPHTAGDGTVIGPQTAGLRVAGYTVGGEVWFGRQGENRVDVDVHAGVSNATFFLRPSEGDGFLRAVLPADGIGFDFDLGVGWSNGRGIYLNGGGGLRADLPVHASLFGIVNVDIVHVEVDVAAGQIDVGLACTARVDLGVIKATVERLGIRLATTFPDRGGNVGPLNLDPRWRPPAGMGVLLDAVVLKGGGHIRNDEGKYSGILQLRVFDLVDATAIGLVTTRQPEGYSLLVIIAAEFPPIPIGFGFSLAGLGGILGLNRAINTKALIAGSATGALDSILFPVDPVARATKVISDLDAIFPPHSGRVVVGLMARIGWGVPRLVTVDLGVVLDLPNPVIVSILGRLAAELPTKQLAIVALHVDLVGVVDTGRGQLSIDATLHDSRIAIFEASGSLALRIGWGENPQFIITVGGFHTAFTPPPGLEHVRRVTINVGDKDNPYIRFEAFLAITSNTLQVGAAVHAHAHLSIFIGTFSADAWAGFEALFQFSPFRFIFRLFLGVAIKWNGNPFLGADLDVSVSGPQPVKAVGHAAVHLLFFTVNIPFELNIGPSAKKAAIQAKDPLPELLSALGNIESWSALPNQTYTHVHVRAVDADALVAHPLGSLTVRQRVIPLEVEIRKYGGAPLPSGGRRRYEVRYRFGSNANVTAVPVRDAWAPADFFDYTDEQRLAAPSFDQLVSGHKEIASSTVTWGAPVDGPPEGYEARFITTEDPAPVSGPLLQIATSMADLLAAQVNRPVATGQLFPAQSLGLVLNEPTYRLASSTTMHTQPQVYASMAEADQARERSGDSDLQVVETHEGR